MATNTRPYICVHNGVTHMVEARDPGAVIRHVVGAAVSELRPARATEVVAWTRDNKTVELAGVAAPAPTTAEPAGALVQSGTIAVADDFNADDAGAWLADALGIEQGTVLNAIQQPVADAFAEARSTDMMTLMQFDQIRAGVPAFGQAIAAAMLSDSTDVDSVRAMIEDRPVQFEVVVSAIAAQKRVELYGDGSSE